MLGLCLGLTDRIREDEGLVSGLTAEEAAVVRAWCVREVARFAVDHPHDAPDYADEVVNRARQVTELLAEWTSGVPERRLIARLGRVTVDPLRAYQVLQSAGSPRERLVGLLSLVQAPLVRH